jgi:hypothetical protein
MTLNHLTENRAFLLSYDVKYRSIETNSDPGNFMKTMKILSIGAVAVALILQQANGQIMLSSFESNTLDGWQQYSGNGMAVVAAPTPSLGVYSWLFTVNNQYWGQSVLPDWANGGVSVANLNANPIISLDLYFPSTGWLASYANVNVQWETGGGSLGTQNGTISTSLGSLSFDTVTHLDVNLSSLMPRDPTATWGNLILFVQPGWVPGTYTPYNVYIDNVQISPVPEPATVGLMGVGLAGLWLIRRRRAS